MIKNKINRRNGRQGLVNSGIYYNSPAKINRCEAVITHFQLTEVKYFIKAFDKMFDVNKSTSTFILSAIYLILLYCGILSSFSTKFTSYLNSRPTSFRCPDFIMSILRKISSDTSSKNKTVGWTEGSITNDISLYSQFHSFFVFIQDPNSDLTDIFGGTNFESIATNSTNRTRFVTEFKIYVEPILKKIEVESSSSDQLSFEYLIELFESITTLTRYQDSIPETFYDKVELYSTDLGIYRFRNSDINSLTYYVSQSSCVSVLHTTLEYFAVVFRVTHPTFYQDTIRYQNCIAFLPGDCEYDVSCATLFESWLKILSYRIVTKPQKPESPKPKIPEKPTGPALAQAANQQFKQPEVPEDVREFSTIAKSNDFLYSYDEFSETCMVFESTLVYKQPVFKLRKRDLYLIGHPIIPEYE